MKKTGSFVGSWNVLIGLSCLMVLLMGVSFTGCSSRSSGMEGSGKKGRGQTNSDSASDSASYNVSHEVGKGFAKQNIKVALVYPLVALPKTGLDSSTLQRLSDRFVTGLDSATALSVVNLISPERVAAVVKQNSVSSSLSTVHFAVMAAKELKADTVFCGEIAQFSSKDYPKSQFGVVGKEQAALRVWVVDVASESVIWSAAYTNREQGLLDNLFTIGKAMDSGGSAVSFLERGVDGIVAAFVRSLTN